MYDASKEGIIYESRKDEIKILTDTIVNNSDISVLAINSPWGTGKTSFIKAWKNQLESSEKPIVSLYFNAWENDDSQNPILSILMEFEEDFSSNELKNLLDIASILKEGAKSILEISRKFIPQLDTACTIGKEIIDFYSKVSTKEESLESKFSEYENEKLKRLFKSYFKDKLKAYQKEKECQIIIFIDELDRCRPSYAIETLEVIKHYFGVDGYIFILSVNIIQLSYSVKTIYGNDMDSEGYLKRFIDLEYELKKIEISKLSQQIFGGQSLKINNGISILSKCMETYNFSIRDVEKLIKVLNINNIDVNMSISENREMISGFDYLALMIKCIMLCLKIKEPILFYTFINKNLDNDKREKLIEKISLNLYELIKVVCMNDSWFQIKEEYKDLKLLKNIIEDLIELYYKGFLTPERKSNSKIEKVFLGESAAYLRKYTFNIIFFLEYEL